MYWKCKLCRFLSWSHPQHLAEFITNRAEGDFSTHFQNERVTITLRPERFLYIDQIEREQRDKVRILNTKQKEWIQKNRRKFDGDPPAYLKGMRH
jgi:hypothetical protein